MTARLLTSAHVSGLPNPLSSLVGRCQEADAAGQQLRDPDVRILTLTGPGGVGKTRLAIRVAADCSDDFADGVLFASLAAIRDPGLVLPAIARAAGLADQPGYSTDAQLTEMLGAQQRLLVLDNFEQVAGAASLLVRLLEICPGVKALVTSRAPLHVAGEHRFAVPPLPVPEHRLATIDEIAASESVALFMQRAREIRPDLHLTEQNAPVIVDICRKLDGLPLALELAAARTTLLSPAALLARLNDRLHLLSGDQQDMPERLRTLRLAIDWSYELLSPMQQSLFRRASVFTGATSSIDSLVWVSQDLGCNTGDWLDHFCQLIDQSLLYRVENRDGETRFSMLESLREYGVEQLRQQGEERSVRDAHAACMLELVEAGRERLIGSGQERWLAELDAEHDDIRAAIEWSLLAGDSETALRIGTAVWRFWSIRGNRTEGRTWLNRALCKEGSASEPVRIAALIAIGQLAEDQNDLSVAGARFTEALHLATSSGDERAASQALGGLGLVAQGHGDYHAATAYHDRSAELARAVNDHRQLGVSLGNLGAIAYYQGDYARAALHWQECRSIVHAQEDPHGEALMVGNLGALAVMRGDLVEGEALLAETLGLQRQLGNPGLIASALVNLGEVREVQGDEPDALALYNEAVALFRQIDDRVSEALAQVRLAKLAHRHHDTPHAVQLLATSARVLAESGDRFGCMETIEELAQIVAQTREPDVAVELLGVVDVMRAALGAPRREAETDAIDQLLSRLRRGLGRGAFDEAWNRGTAQPIDETLSMIDRFTRRLRPASHATAPEPEHPRLTNRERDVLRLVAGGCSNRDIADALFISPRTASTHVEHILTKLGVNTRSAAVAVAMREGLV